ncbi:hypothetical protein ACFWAP_12340 [Streptomyces goshikiensis]|uniref:hypothetical protein n=1 Tax=Streptomyces goshikiensis TaxID=1942 RepID=UPI00366A34FA
MPEQLPVTSPDTDTDAEPNHLDDKPVLDLTAVRTLKKSRTDVEALEITDEQLRHFTDSVAEMVDTGRALRQQYANQEDDPAPHPVREDDQRAHHPQEPGPHHG